MRAIVLIGTAGIVTASLSLMAQGRQQEETEDPVVRALVSRLSLDQYKATLKGLTQFGDRRQGTKRNRDAIDWIEAQLQAVGCTTTARINYVYDPEPRQRRGRRRGGAGELNPTGGTPTGRTDRSKRLGPGWQLDLRLPRAHRCNQRSDGAAR